MTKSTNDSPSSGAPSDGNGQGTGDGGVLRENLQSGGRRGESLKFLRMAAEKGWNVKEEDLAELPDIAVQIAKTAKSLRNRLRALQVVRGMVGDRVKAIEALDHIDRLDSDQPTENIKFQKDLQEAVADPEVHSLMEQAGERMVGITMGDLKPPPKKKRRRKTWKSQESRIRPKGNGNGI